jgi:arylformamidase
MDTSMGIQSDNFDRIAAFRKFLFTAVSFVLASGCASAQQGLPVTVPGKVWLNMDQAELDAAYTQRNWAPNQAEVLARYKSASEKFRSSRKPPLRLKYGPSDIQALDIWPPDKPNGKILIFIHGGAWSGGSAAEYSFLASPFLDRGVIVVIPDFTTVQDVNGSLEPMAAQVRNAIAFIFRTARSLGANPKQIYVAGHSSGAHLAAIALTTDWSSLDIKGNPLKGGILCGGIYDLKPVRLSSRSQYIKFTDGMEESMSPQRNLKELSAPVTLAYGLKESPEFKRQAIDFADAMRKAKKKVEVITVDLNHFEILETLANPQSALFLAALKMMK